MFRELETQYGFVGGSKNEYIKCLPRKDIGYLWEWDRYEGNVGIGEMSICNFTGLVFGPYHLECLARLDVDAF